MIKSKTTKALIATSKKGYYVDETGNVFYKNKVRKLSLNKNGYYNFKVRVKINKKNILYTIYVHRLSAYQKYGNKIFRNNIQVRHLDSNSKNNNKSNIGIGSVSDNHFDKPKDVRLKIAINAASYTKIHNHEEIVKLHKEGISYESIMKKHGISSKGTISFIIKKSIESKK